MRYTLELLPIAMLALTKSQPYSLTESPPWNTTEECLLKVTLPQVSVEFDMPKPTSRFGDVHPLPLAITAEFDWPSVKSHPAA